jgi:AcrR family transcriptional regulator
MSATSTAEVTTRTQPVRCSGRPGSRPSIQASVATYRANAIAFDSRDALLTALVVEGHNRLTAAVREAADTSRGRPHTERLFAVTNAYRAWALANRPEFLLLHATPVPGYAAPTDGPAGDAAYRLAEPFMEVVFEGWTAEELAAVPLQPGAEGLAEVDPELMPLPLGALAVSYELRARMHGLVMLELFGHLVPLGGHEEELFRGAMSRVAAELAVLRAAIRS